MIRSTTNASEPRPADEPVIRVLPPAHPSVSPMWAALAQVLIDANRRRQRAEVEARIPAELRAQVAADAEREYQLWRESAKNQPRKRATDAFGRPKRVMPSWGQIHRCLDIPVDEAPECWICGSGRRVEKAHVIEREFGGLDLPCNVRPLCHQCHASQPQFPPDLLDWALDWFDMEVEPALTRVFATDGPGSLPWLQRYDAEVQRWRDRTFGRPQGEEGVMA